MKLSPPKRSTQRWRWLAQAQRRSEIAELMRSVAAYNADPNASLARMQARGGWRPEGVRICRAMRWFTCSVY